MFMGEAGIYKKYKRRNGLRWRIQGSIDKHFFAPKGKRFAFEMKYFAKKKILEREESNALIAELIKSGKPFWVGRYGASEMQFLNSVLFEKYGNGKIGFLNWDIESRLAILCKNAGFFPEKIEFGLKYADACFEAAHNMDIHAMWDIWMEEYMLGRFETEAKVMRWKNMAPYYQREKNGDVPWTSALKGKKVLVINPFVDSIAKQYEDNRTRLFSKIFDADMILPEFELKTLKSVQTIAGNTDSRFSNWFEALDWMIEECRKIDFDVALIGCGAYGFLLANAIKLMGKGAIQTCGSTQMFFGVLGERWTNDKILMGEVINEFWVRPSDYERVPDSDKVEGSCYW